MTSEQFEYFDPAFKAEAEKHFSPPLRFSEPMQVFLDVVDSVAVEVKAGTMTNKQASAAIFAAEREHGLPSRADIQAGKVDLSAHMDSLHQQAATFVITLEDNISAKFSEIRSREFTGDLKTSAADNLKLALAQTKLRLGLNPDWRSLGIDGMAAHGPKPSAYASELMHLARRMGAKPPF